MKKPKKRWPRVLRRIAALTLVFLLLRGLYAGVRGLGLSLPSLAGTGDALAQALVQAELGAYRSDEPSLWEQMVTQEMPLTTSSASETEETESPESPEDPEEEGIHDHSDVEEVLPASDSPDGQTETEEEPVPEETKSLADPEEDGGSATPETITRTSNTVSANGVDVNNSTSGITVDSSLLAASLLTQTIAPASEGPQILIMHTHATESYTMAGDDYYTETDNSRTDDADYNMIRIGEEMKQVFEDMGFSVLHDKTLYDYPSYSGSYTRSLAGVQSYLEQYPSLSVVLDVHRDALIASDGTVYKAVTEIDGVPVAQVMLVVGTNDGGLNHPNWRDNLNLASYIQLQMSAIEPTLCRPITLRAQRFNQHLSPCSLLVEVGTSGNTLQEAIRGARYFAQAAGEVYLTLLEG